MSTAAEASSSSFAFRAAVAALTIGTAASLVAYKSAKNKKNKSTMAGEQETWESHCTGHGPLQEVWPDTLFVLEAKGCSQGPPTRNMVIYKIPDKSGRLVVYNGIAVDENTVKQIETLGTPSVLIVPNFYHRCCAAVWKRRFPEIMVVCPHVERESAEKVVQVTDTTENWASMTEWKDWITARTIDGWGDFEVFLEVKLQNKENAKKAVLVCDLLLTVPYDDDPSFVQRLAVWIFDSSIELPPEGQIVVPKVARLSRIFAIQDWAKAEAWYREYADEHGKEIAAICTGHGVVVNEIASKNGCTEAFLAVADQLSTPRW